MAVFSLLQEGLVGRASAFSILIISIVFVGDRILYWISKGKRSLLG